jgi:RND family efflux transporter MFP subunit
MDINKSLTFVTEDEQWVTKFIIGAVLALFSIFIIPGLFLAGYTVRLTRNVMDGMEQPLPEWTDWGGLFMDGLYIFIAMFVGFVLFSCTSNKDGKSADEIRNQINKYKIEVKKLEKNISILEKQLDTIGQEQTLGRVVNVAVSKLSLQPFQHYFIATGAVEAKYESYISPQTNGKIDYIYIEEGDKVTKGQLLARLNTEIIENNIDEVEVNLELAKTLYEKQKELWNKKIGSEVQYLQAKNNYFSLKSRLKTLQSQYDLSFIKSPLTGVVDEVYQKVGEMGTPGMRLVHVVSLSPLTLKAKISERYIPAIHVGDSVQVTFPTFPDMKIMASINRIGYVVNPANRTFDIEVNLNNSNNKIKPRLSVSV